MTELLQVEYLSKQYPGFTLQDISFSVKPGRIMGLIGKNGAGKSTTLKSILNMVRPESGTVTMLGKDFYANENSSIFTDTVLLNSPTVSDYGRFRYWNLKTSTKVMIHVKMHL